MCIRYQIIIRSEPEGGYAVLVPALTGYVKRGKTVKQAREMAVDVIEGYLVNLLKHTEAVPVPGG